MLKITPGLLNFERLEHYLKREIHGMLKSFTIRRISSPGYLVKSNSSTLPGVVLACLGYFWFILPRSCLIQLVVVGHGFFHIL